MKPILSTDGGRAHELTKTEQRAILRATEVVEKLACFYRNTPEGEAQKGLADQLALVAFSKSLVADSDEVEQ